MESNPKLITGKFTAEFSYADSCKKWEELKNILNAVGYGPNDRGVKEWKKVTDFIYKLFCKLQIFIYSKLDLARVESKRQR